jgi:hypothetical protein
MTYQLSKYTATELGNIPGSISDVSFYITSPTPCCPDAPTDMHDSTYIFMRNDVDATGETAS